MANKDAKVVVDPNNSNRVIGTEGSQAKGFGADGKLGAALVQEKAASGLRALIANRNKKKEEEDKSAATPTPTPKPYLGKKVSSK